MKQHNEIDYPLLIEITDALLHGADPYTGEVFEEGHIIHDEQLALSRLGHPYSMDLRGQGNYIDCSGLTQWCYAQVGISLPNTAADQAKWCADNGKVIDASAAQPGDLVFYTSSSPRVADRYGIVYLCGTRCSWCRKNIFFPTHNFNIFNTFPGEKQCYHFSEFIEPKGVLYCSSAILFSYHIVKIHLLYTLLADKFRQYSLNLHYHNSRCHKHIL